MLELRVTNRLPTKAARLVSSTVDRLPFATKRSIALSFQPELKAYRGRLLSGHDATGTPVHAAGFVRERQIVLETRLLRDPSLLRLILVHELFHFVWPRLGNQNRAGFQALLRHELSRGARGELGESAAVGKTALLLQDVAAVKQARLFRHYACESFCDTAAFLYAGVEISADFTLAPRYVRQRRLWFEGGINWRSGCY